MFHHTRADHELAQRHVTEGERRVARQRDPIAELEQDGHPIEQARDLLQNMVDLLDQMLKHSEEIAKKCLARLMANRMGRGSSKFDSELTLQMREARLSAMEPLSEVKAVLTRLEGSPWTSFANP